MTRCGWLLVFVPLMLEPSPVGAQPRDSARRAAAHALQPGQRVRLDVARTGRVEGRFAVASDTSLILGLEDGTTEVRVLDIERLWVRRRATAKGALIGAGAGALAGVVFGILISTVACEPVDGGNCTAAEVAALTGLVGGAGGAAVGAGVGFAIPVWRLRFP
jgi:hypothetical protein